ncbi:Ricin-type beta-trefoil lectin domain-containing protein [Streptomyces sp. 1222.2]|uniref:RICIN domain-containing protein n=1 Tax=Streptomyces sp. 1222.2 TaxID=1938833 RepID=UPI000BDD56EB|nr:RICIN domain-containing protein [Streptomyces sp. 1222.2]SOD76935.1 Ricin-type beta-trefoil lectin domain-containing protein [Streptomyces sp. 1222.2]
MTRARDERPDDDSHENRQGTGAPGARPDDGSEHRHANASDARLTALLRTDSPIAYTALRELRERHHPSVLAYARLCAASESSARELATQAFTIATRETARGSEAAVPWRHQLLLLTVRVAATWTTDEHATGLAPALRPVLATAGPDGPVPPLLAAFRSLATRPQGLIWYGVVEQEPENRTAVLLGLTADDVTYMRESALQALRQACLRGRLAASDDPRCQDFRRLIEESVRPDSPRHSTDLRAHMEHCPYCSGAYEELCALRDSPRATLAEGLLPWGGTAYTRGGVGGRAGAGAAADFSEPENGADGTGGATGGTWGGSGAGGWAGASAATATAAGTWTGSGPGDGSGGGGAPGSGMGSGSGSGPVGSGSGADRGGPGAGPRFGSGAGAGAGAGDRSVDGAAAEPSGGASAWAEAWAGPGDGAWAGAGDGAGAAAGADGEAVAGKRGGPGTAAGSWAAGPETESFAASGAGPATGSWAAEGGSGGRGAGAKWSRSRRIVLTSVALGVALAPLLAFLVFSGSVGSSSSDDVAGSGGTPAAPPSGAVTPTVPPSPTPSPTPSETASPSKPPRKEKPTRSPSPSPSDTGSPTPSSPYGPPLSGAYTQVVNIASGLCLDIRGELAKGTDVVTATCSSRATQRWRVDSGRDALQSFADPDLCLDSRGAIDDGVGVWECDSLDGDKGDNLRFEVDSRGVIRPAIAGRFAVTPDALGSVGFAVASGRDGQRWRAGSGPASA